MRADWRKLFFVVSLAVVIFSFPACITALLWLDNALVVLRAIFTIDLWILTGYIYVRLMRTLEPSIEALISRFAEKKEKVTRSL